MNFVQYNTQLEADDAVIFHEVGHAVIAFIFGYQIGRIAFVRLPCNRLAGACRFKETIANTMEHEVMRLLAGEISARISLGLPTNELCHNDDVRSDIQKVLNQIDVVEMWNLHQQTIDIIIKNWATITSAVEIVKKQKLPESQRAPQLLITGLNIIQTFEHSQLLSEISSIPTEVVHPNLKGSISTRISRYIRKNIKRNLNVSKDEFPNVKLPF